MVPPAAAGETAAVIVTFWPTSASAGVTVTEVCVCSAETFTVSVSELVVYRSGSAGINSAVTVYEPAASTGIDADAVPPASGTVCAG